MSYHIIFLGRQTDAAGAEYNNQVHNECNQRYVRIECDSYEYLRYFRQAETHQTTCFRINRCTRVYSVASRAFGSEIFEKNTVFFSRYYYSRESIQPISTVILSQSVASVVRSLSFGPRILPWKLFFAIHMYSYISQVRHYGITYGVDRE
jgi:hypothetical protein